MNKKIEMILSRYCKSAWYDFSHLHPSLLGLEERNLRMIVEMERFVGKRLSNRKLAHQRWIAIDLNDSEMDALYVHSANPNSDNFPVKLEPGRITNVNRNRYEAVLKHFTKSGYAAFKLKGHPTIIAMQAILRAE